MRLEKNLFFLTSIMIGSAFIPVLHAEDWAVDRGSAYTKGSKKIQFGLAVVPVGLVAAYEYGFFKAISGGIATGVMIDPHAYLPMIVRAAFHPFNLKELADKIPVRDKLDVYIGLATGFEIGEDAPHPFIIREYLGVRFYLNSKFGLFAEDCAGLGFLNLGLIMKL